MSVISALYPFIISSGKREIFVKRIFPPIFVLQHVLQWNCSVTKTRASVKMQSWGCLYSPFDQLITAPSCKLWSFWVLCLYKVPASILIHWRKTVVLCSAVPFFVVLNVDPCLLCYRRNLCYPWCKPGFQSASVFFRELFPVFPPTKACLCAMWCIALLLSALKRKIQGWILIYVHRNKTHLPKVLW